MSKGISPLTASVILIAFTMIIASLIAWWTIKNLPEIEPKKDLIDMTCEELEQKYRDAGFISWRTEIATVMILKKCDI